MKLQTISLLAVVLTRLAVAVEEEPRLQREYDPAKWPAANLKLSKAATLKDLFDSGLRPYRHPGLESALLEVKHLKLTIELGSGKALPEILTEVINIETFIDGEVSTIEGFTPKLTLSQARVEMQKWLPFAANNRTQKDLDNYIEAVRADYLDFDDPYSGISDGCGVGWKEAGFGSVGGGPKVGLGFRKTASETHPLRLYFGLDWGLNRPIKDRVIIRKDPIPPPPGYEGVDMTAPANFGPDSAVDILRSQGVDIGDGKGGIPYEEFRKRQAHREVPGPQPGSIQSKGFSWWWLIAAATGVFVVVGIVAQRRRTVPPEGLH